MTERVLPEIAAEERAHVEVDLDVLAANHRALARRVAPARILPVVKADAYGHGAVAVARRLEGLAPVALLVARPEEGVELRRGGVSVEILVGSPVARGVLELLAAHDLTPVVSDLADLEALEAFAAATGWRPRVHLEADTGMRRLGLSPEAWRIAIARMRASSHLIWSGVASHLGDAEAPESPRNDLQEMAFRERLGELTAGERDRLLVHFANSAGALTRPGCRFGAVRPGLALYGGEVVGAGDGELRPALSIRARVRQLRDVAPGEAIGYGGRWTAARPSRIGVVGLGYADGYPWRAGGRAEALAAGCRVPVVGAVSMDLLAVDLTGVDAGRGDEVVLLGHQGEREIRLAELARWAGTIPYEILCAQRLRLPRVHVGAERETDGGAP